MKQRLAWVAVFLLVSGAATAATNELSDAEIEGRQLAQQLCNARPTENFTNTGFLQIRDSNGKRTNISITFTVRVSPTNWTSIYTSSAMNPWEERLFVTHTDNLTNVYLHYLSSVISTVTAPAADTSPFANSDFWLADLGLEFFHWPAQKVLKHEMRRGQGCKVLESTNPEPSTNGYSRVVSWIGNESGGIVQAEAYDAKGKLLKEFRPKNLKKVNGQWQVESMEIQNVQTGSRTRLAFNLEKK
jgi:hypothetical protein